jgi:RNA 3'-terminal phosphate cyclase (ATP)
MGVQAQLRVIRWGFYPAGGGEMAIEIAGQPSESPLSALRPIHLVERGPLQRVWGLATVLNLPAHIPQRMSDRARSFLKSANLNAPVEVTPQRLGGAGAGAGIFLMAEYAHVTAGFTAYGRKGLPAEQVAEAACDELLAHHCTGAPADPHLADQLTLPMALAASASRLHTSQVSQHLLTNAWIVGHLLARQIHIEGELGAPGCVTVTDSLQITSTQG